MHRERQIAILGLLVLAAGLAFIGRSWKADQPMREGISQERTLENEVGEPRGINLEAELPLAEEPALHAAATERTAANRKQQAPKIKDGLGCVSGRVLFNGEPLRASVVLTLKESKKPTVVSPDGEVQLLESLGYVGETGDALIPENAKERWTASTGIVGSMNMQIGGRTSCDDSGEFSICVGPGMYSFDIHIGTQEIPFTEVTVVEGETNEIGILDLTPEDAARAFRDARTERRKLRGAVTVHTGQPGLAVKTTTEGQRKARHRATTNSLGDATFQWDDAGPIRIDVVDKNKFVLGSSDAFELFPEHVASERFIPSAPGSLKIYLPSGSLATKGETYQIHLTRTDSPGLDLRVKSIAAKRIPIAEKGYRSSPNSLEYKALRTGTYDVKAIRMVPWGEKQHLLTNGEWMRGSAVVFAGQMSHCSLE